MSYKGFTRSLARAPQQFKAKFNLGEVSKDQVYLDAERRFKEFDQDCKKLNGEFKRYFNAIKGTVIFLASLVRIERLHHIRYLDN